MNSTGFLPITLGLIIFSFTISSILLVPFINFLYKYKMVRHKEAPKNGKVPLFDKLHDIKAGTPTGGGILIISLVSILFALVFTIVSKYGIPIKSNHPINLELFIMFFTFITFGLLGFSDDLLKIFGKARHGLLGLWLGMRRRDKLIVQLVLALIISIFLYKYLGIQILHLPFPDTTINLGIFYIPFAAFTIVFFTNAFNFTDGLDGLSSGLLMIYLSAFAIISASHIDTAITIFIALWLGSIIAFLYFNIWPARIFLGDTGALSFGAMIAVIGLLTGNVASLFIIGGIFVIEAISSLIQILGWKYLKKPILPLAPIHHAFLAIGWEEPKIVTRAWLAGIMLAVFGIWLATI